MKKKIIIIVIFIMLITLIGINSFTYAKYVFNSAKDYYFKSKGFYFYSDKLDINNNEIINNYWDGESISFNINNYLNNEVISEYDINYTAECIIKNNVNAKCYLNDLEVNKFNNVLKSNNKCINNKDDGIDTSLFTKKECLDKEYLYQNEKVSDNISFKIVPDNGYSLSDVEVEIKVVSTSPYIKTLSAVYKLYKDNNKLNNIVVNYNDYDMYGDLIITNSYNEKKCVKVSWNNDLKLDNSNVNFKEILEDNNYINGFIIEINPNSNLKYTFYKFDYNINYNINEFNYEEVGC